MIFYDFFGATKVVWTCIHAYGGEWVNNCITILATNGSERSATATFGYNTLENVCSRFRIPLQKANVNCLLVPEEWDDMVDYAKCYLI